MPIECGPFEFHKVDIPAKSAADVKKAAPGADYRSIQNAMAHLRRCEHYASGLYHVAVDKETEHGFGDMGEGELWHLSIKRHDREPMQDWRVMQRIKTAICGPESEGLELYPAESRVVDTANQYHLYVFVNCGTLPFGFQAGARSDKENAGSRQRPGSGGNTADHWTGDDHASK